jgi:hypothetical protein
MRVSFLVAASVAVMACLVLSGCGSSGAAACLPARNPAPANCASTTFVDATQSDPVCLDTVSGTAICRGGDDAVCYVCTGADFTDGCEVRGSQTIECVHSCDKC